MTPSSGLAKFLRFVGILFMSLTAGFTVLGGAGTSCAALAPTNWDSMAPLAPFQWLYILYVVVTIAIGILGIRAVVLLVKGAPNSYKATLIALVSGVVVGGIHIATSRMLRGSSMPVDAVVGMTVITLVIFLLFRIPGVWSGVDYSKAPKKANRKAGGAAALVVAGLCLTIQYWMGSTHTWDGVNYANAFNASMSAIASVLVLLGTGLLFFDRIVSIRAIQRAHRSI
jgi:hypothetical protein